MDAEIIFGRHPVTEAVQSGRVVHKIWVNEQARGLDPKLMENIKEKQIAIQYVPKKKLDQMANSPRHQGIVASVVAHEYASIDALFKRAETKEEMPFFLMLDGLEDPHNLGSILRSADAIGAHGVIIPKNRAVGLTSAVAKSSTGAIEHVPVARVTNLSRTIEALKEKGLWFVGTDAQGKQDYRELSGDIPLCLVIGSEGKGMSRLVREKCDFLVNIPMVGHVTSLNASVAAALLMYEVYRARQSQGE